MPNIAVSYPTSLLDGNTVRSATEGVAVSALSYPAQHRAVARVVTIRARSTAGTVIVTYGKVTTV